MRWARTRGIVVAKLTQVDGIPDRIFFVPGGSPVIVEFKAPSVHGRALQALTQPWYAATLIAAGYVVQQCDSRAQFLEVMKEYEQCRINVLSKIKKSKT